MSATLRAGAPQEAPGASLWLHGLMRPSLDVKAGDVPGFRGVWKVARYHGGEDIPDSTGSRLARDRDLGRMRRVEPGQRRALVLGQGAYGLGGTS